MGKFFKLFALILGAFTMASGVTSCKKEECCTWTDDFEDTYSFCEEDLLVTAFGGWDYIKAEAASYGGTCD